MNLLKSFKILLTNENMNIFNFIKKNAIKIIKRNHYTLNELKNMGITVKGNNIKINKSVKIYNPTNLILHDNIRIDDFSIISCNGKVEISNYIHISSYCLIISSTKIFFDDFTNISSGTKLFGANDNYSGKYLIGPTVSEIYRNVTKKDIILKKYSIVGAGSIIMPGITIEEGTAIGSLSLVNKNTEPWKIYAGSPIKYLKDRQNECIEYENLIKQEINDIKINGTFK